MADRMIQTRAEAPEHTRRSGPVGEAPAVFTAR